MGEGGAQREGKERKEEARRCARRMNREEKEEVRELVLSIISKPIMMFPCGIVEEGGHNPGRRSTLPLATRCSLKRGDCARH